MNYRLSKLKISIVSILIAFLMVGITSLDAQADDRTKTFAGSGSGTSQITNPDECAATGKCEIDFHGEFNSADMGMGEARFNFIDDMSGISNLSSSCSVPAPGANNFVWETDEGDTLIMTQTIGFICPSDETGRGAWNRYLKVKAGTGKFNGVTGTVFIAGTRVMATGENTSWTFEGSLTFPVERAEQNGCYRGYFIEDTMVIPPQGDPPLLPRAIMFWLCADDITLGGPDPREGYRIFNPMEME